MTEPRSERSLTKRLLEAGLALRFRRHIMIDAMAIGIVGALAAQVFMHMLDGSSWLFLHEIAHYKPPQLPADGGTLDELISPSRGLWLIPVVTTLGGLIAGLLLYTLAPEADRLGTDTVVKSYHTAKGRFRPIVAPLKMVTASITIGSGGSAGREGQTALLSAWVSSMLAIWTRRPAHERRLLAIAGMAAGLSSIFRSPIGTALFATEVLYRGMELEAGALLYTLLASIVAYGVNGLFVGYAPLFQVPVTDAVPSILHWGWYAVLGIAAGIVATALPAVFYGTRDVFKRIPIPNQLKPAVGGLMVGLIAMALPEVLGGGYGWTQWAIDGKLSLTLLVVLLLVKPITLSLTVSSGGSGGVFAPTMFIGAMLGGVLAKLLHEPSAPLVVAGMASVYAAAARIPLATLIMVVEMTGDYQMLVPASLAVSLAFIVQTALARPLTHRTLYEAQVWGRADSPAHRARE